MHDSPPVSKVYYRPIEAAIRWAGLLKHKKNILRLISSPRNLPTTLNFPGWAELRLCRPQEADCRRHVAVRRRRRAGAAGRR